MIELNYTSESNHKKGDSVFYYRQTLSSPGTGEAITLPNESGKVTSILISLSGSANLRSSNCLEQFVIQESPELYEFYKNWFLEYNQFSIIDKNAVKPDEVTLFDQEGK